MKNQLPTVKKTFLSAPASLFVLIISVIISSCTTQKQLTYLQGIDSARPDNFFPYTRPEYRLQKQDILYINITTQNEEINAMINQAGGSAGSQMTQMLGGGGYLMGYTLNDSGYINLPLLGDVFVLEKTLNDVTKLIEEKAAKMLKDSRVIVKLLSYNITILGEVKGPGTKSHYGNQLTVLDAIGMAGDLTDIADRGRVLVIRPTKEGSKTFRINLKDKNLLVSEGYFLLPNDIVIVEPRKIKLLTLNSQAISLVFSTVVSTISLTLLILNLNK